jgi:hypothetical protein
MLFHVLVHCKHTLDQGSLTWRHNSILNHIAGCRKSALVGKSTVELHFDFDGLQAPGGGSILTDIMEQVQQRNLSNEGWDCSLYMIEVGARGHILKIVKDCFQLLFWAWVLAGHRSGIGQMMKDVSRISLVCSFAIFPACNDPIWNSPHLVVLRLDRVPTVE